MILLGIGPGSRVTGWGCIAVEDRFQYVAHGTIRLETSSPLSERLGYLYIRIRELVGEFGVTEAAVESVFTSRNVSSALKLGEARGAILAALGSRGVVVEEYAPARVKAMLTRYGRATKEQLREIVSYLLGIDTRLPLDASDALAVALTHAMTRGMRGELLH